MHTKLLAVAAGVAALAFLSGCLGRFAANQGRRHAARSADHYVHKYAERELLKRYPDDPEAREEARRNVRQGRNELADTIVRTGNERQRARVGVDDRGWLTNEY